MSTKVMALVWGFFQGKRFGADKIVALALADEADDSGGSISASISGLATKADLSVDTIRRQLRRMEAAGLVLCQARSVGGVGKFSEYSLNLAVLVGGENPGSLQGLTLAICRGSEPQNPSNLHGFESPPYISSTKEVLSTKDKDVGDRLAAGVSEDAEYRRLAEWMFGLLVQLNPRVRKPSWPGWCRDLRFMVQRDRHTLREIAELFKFANAHPFWQSNIESPGKLRKQWNRLLLERDKAGGTSAVATPVDTSCSGVKPDGKRCGATNTTSDSADGRGPFFCWDCRISRERELAGAGGARRDVSCETGATR